jgi:hypothetical protein
MKNIEITVMKKVAYADGMPTIVCGNNDYTLSFKFDDEWNDEQNKVARFSFTKNGLKGFIDMPIENNTCKVPVLLGIGLVRVGVYAGNLRTTTGAKIKCTKSILCDDAEEMAEPFENLYEEIKGSIADLEKATIQTINSPKIWELDAGVYRVSGEVSYGKFESSVKTNSINLLNKVGFLMVGLSPSLSNQRDFYLFANNKVYFGYSVDMGLKVEGAISGEFSKVTKEISTASTHNDIPTAEAVLEYVNETIEGIESGGGGSDYTLPIGGDELGGVKNGGNVIINEDGTMTAPESSGNTSNQSKRHYGTFSVLGDSYSTFVDFVTPNTNLCWYPAGNSNATGSNNDISKIEQMWWHIFATEYKSALQVNNSYSGSPICYNGWGDGETDSTETGFIARAKNIGTPELIFVLGGSNDDWVNATIGEYKYADWTEDDFVSFRPSLAYLLNYLKQHNVGAKIVFILNENLDAEIDTSVLTICEHYGVDVIELKNIVVSNGHPTIAGQSSIAQQVLEYMKTCDIEIPDEPIASISAVLSQTEFTSGVTLDNLRTYLTVTATFESGATAIVEDYELSGELVAGENTITISYGGATTTVTVEITAESGTYQLSVETLDASNYQYYCPVFHSSVNENIRVVFTKDFELFSNSSTIKKSATLPTSLKNAGTDIAKNDISAGNYVDITTTLTSEQAYFTISIPTKAVNPLTLKNFHCYIDGVEVEPVKWVAFGHDNVTAVKLA